MSTVGASFARLSREACQGTEHSWVGGKGKGDYSFTQGGPRSGRFHEKVILEQKFSMYLSKRLPKISLRF